jgi:MATE family multidrug resistance protein
MPYQTRSSSVSTARGILRDAMPIWAFYLTEIMVGLTDLAVVGALGTDALAAVGLGKTILFSFLTVGFAIVSVGTILMAENLSAIRCGQVPGGSLIVSSGFAGLAVAISAAAPSLLLASGYKADLIDLFRAYVTVLAFATGPAMAFAVLKNVLVAHGRTGAISWLSVGIVVGNLVGSMLLVHGLGPWEGLGVSGAAWATVGANACAAAALFVLILRQRLARFAGRALESAFACGSEIVALGWAAGGQQLLESLLFVMVLYLLGTYSPLWLAAGTLVFAVMELNFAASAALGEVLSARLAAARSRFELRTLMRLLRLGAILSGAGAAGLALVVLLVPQGIVWIFSGADTDDDARSFYQAIECRVALARFSGSSFRLNLGWVETGARLLQYFSGLCSGFGKTKRRPSAQR